MEAPRLARKIRKFSANITSKAGKNTGQGKRLDLARGPRHPWPGRQRTEVGHAFAQKDDVAAGICSAVAAGVRLRLACLAQPVARAGCRAPGVARPGPVRRRHRAATAGAGAARRGWRQLATGRGTRAAALARAVGLASASTRPARGASGPRLATGCREFRRRLRCAGLDVPARDPRLAAGTDPPRTLPSRPALSRRPLRAGRRAGHRPPIGSAVSAGCATAPATRGAAGPARRPALRGAYRLAPAGARATRPAGAADAGQPARAVRWRRPLAGAPGGARPAGHPWPGGLAQSLVAGSPAPARRTASPASASGLDDPPGAWQRLAGAAPGARRRWLGGAAGAGSASLAAARSG